MAGLNVKGLKSGPIIKGIAVAIISSVCVSWTTSFSVSFSYLRWWGML